MMDKVKRTIGGLLFTVGIFLGSAGNAQTQLEEEPVVVVNSDKILADKAKIDKEILLVDSLLTLIGLKGEEEIPSDELYDGQWNNDYVKTYADITVPDTYSIDISEFVIPVEGKVTSKYGKRRRRFHYGTDIKLQVGDTVRAAFSGKVRMTKYERRGYGNYIVLRHSNGLETVYGHLSRFLVNEEENVVAGQAIALGGNTGRSTGSHLHFEFRFLGRAINPEEIIDFEQLCAKDEVYVYEKGKSELPISKYTAKGKDKIKYYRIKKGDTLSTIARKSGVSVNTICKLNKMNTKTTLRVGRSIRLS
ncbi:MAG: peptidoglycan DD-metalloendopeptidase family protein [Dysgonamonadaceae bacterium]|jgi:murein DD-endopeptidase MepM/ murein hydrolase activator NlpD|nr:peptidoglycan DD-metalloendopeptidase family protein [Dysgonamonadaceae bacterium]